MKTDVSISYSGLKAVHSAVAKRVLPLAIRSSIRPLWANSRIPVPTLRRITGALLANGWVPRDAVISEESLKGNRTEVIRPAAGAGENVVFYVHGGGYVVCSPRTHRPLTSRLALALNATVYVPHYRLAPEFPFPHGLNDVLAAYEGLLASGVDASRITLMGDSAGGGMALSLAISIRDKKLPMPARMILISPWTDLTLSGESLSTKARADHMLTLSWIHAKTPLYRGKTDASHPLLSPLFADLSGLPPTLVQTGSEEILLSDSERLAERAAEIGWDLQLTVWQGLWHDFQLLGDLLPEADDAIAAMARFVALRAR